MSLLNGRSGLALFSEPTGARSHRVRFVIAAKGVRANVIDTDPDKPSEDLIDLNPYQSVPTLVDRDLVLYDPDVISEYLDERYPHPPLMAVDPVTRARCRLALFRIRKDWYRLVDVLDSGDRRRLNKARRDLRESITASAEVFSAGPYFLSDELTLVDCAIAPLLWRLRYYSVDLPRQAKPVIDYAERLFALESFRKSLTRQEREFYR